MEQLMYLALVLSYDENNVTSIPLYLEQTWATLGRIVKIVVHKEIVGTVVGMYYHTMVAAVLLCCSNSRALPHSGCI